MLDYRIGHGYDIHRIKLTGRMVLAGIEVSTHMSPDSYSDGDVVLHAIVDAILGAIGAGDIGEHFSDKDPRWKGADSSIFVKHALELAKQAGYVVSNADVSIIAEKPKLKEFKPAMKASLESLLNAPANIKAGTNEGCDSVGKVESIVCHAVVLLRKIN